MTNNGIVTIKGVTLAMSRRTYDNERLYAGYATQCGAEGEAPGALWEVFRPGLVPNCVSETSNAGLSLPGQRKGCFTYLVAAEVSARGNVPARQEGIPESAEFICASMPAGERLVCTFCADDFDTLVTSAMATAMEYLFGEFVSESGLKIGSPCAELYDERCLNWHPSAHLRTNAPRSGLSFALSDGDRPEMEIHVPILK